MNDQTKQKIREAIANTIKNFNKKNYCDTYNSQRLSYLITIKIEGILKEAIMDVFVEELK